MSTQRDWSAKKSYLKARWFCVGGNCATFYKWIYFLRKYTNHFISLDTKLKSLLFMGECLFSLIGVRKNQLAIFLAKRNIEALSYVVLILWWYLKFCVSIYLAAMLSLQLKAIFNTRRNKNPSAFNTCTFSWNKGGPQPLTRYNIFFTGSSYHQSSLPWVAFKVIRSVRCQ